MTEAVAVGRGRNPGVGLNSAMRANGSIVNSQNDFPLR